MDPQLVVQKEYPGKPARYWIITWSGELCGFSGQDIVASYLGIPRHTIELAVKNARDKGLMEFEVEMGLGTQTVYMEKPKDYAPAPTWRPTQPPVERDKSKPLLVGPLVVGFAMWRTAGSKTEDDYGKRQRN